MRLRANQDPNLQETTNPDGPAQMRDCDGAQDRGLQVNPVGRGGDCGTRC